MDKEKTRRLDHRSYGLLMALYDVVVPLVYFLTPLYTSPDGHNLNFWERFNGQYGDVMFIMGAILMLSMVVIAVIRLIASFKFKGSRREKYNYFGSLVYVVLQIVMAILSFACGYNWIFLLTLLAALISLLLVFAEAKYFQDDVD